MLKRALRHKIGENNNMGGYTKKDKEMVKTFN
jgi:hypothetical protein